VEHDNRGTWLALVTVACWAILPVTLKIASRNMDAYTLTWYRFAISAVVLGAILRGRKGLPRLATLRSRHTLVLALVATAGLAINYVLYLVSLSYASPTAGAVVTQLGPILLMVGGIRLYGERLNRRQWIGVALIGVGLMLFFNRRLAEVADFSGRAGVGTLILLAASVAWAAYGLAQKALVAGSRFTSQQVLFLIYVGASIILIGFSAPGGIGRLPALELAMILACALNTLIAYGALAEALKHSGAARVGAVLAASPVAALFVTWMTNHIAPGFFEPDLLNAATIVGAFTVAVGSAMSAAK
jgi:drug/metabolite transporter (DMT)-like permease